MSAEAKNIQQSWSRHTALAGTVLACAALAAAVMPGPAEAQWAYDYGYPGPAYSYSPYSYPGYGAYPYYGYQYYGGGDWGSHRGWRDRNWRGEDGRHREGHHELASEPPLHEHRHKTPARTALLLILGSSPMAEGIPAFFAAGKYGVGLIAIMAVVFL